jgi:type II secretory ATPase GspE/PulE/Tfp pilus assembly ATPase PilB-like protein
MARKRLGEILIDAGILTQEKLMLALKEQQRWGGQLGGILVEKGFLTEKSLIQALSHQLKFPIVSVAGLKIKDELKKLVPENVVKEHNLIPVKSDGKFLDVAMSSPLNVAIIDELRIRTQLNIRPLLAEPSTIEKAIRENYGVSGIGTGIIHNNNEVTFDFDDDEPENSTQSQSKELSGERLRNAEVLALQQRISKLEGLVARDENVIRKLMGLLIAKGVASREEVLEAIS